MRGLINAFDPISRRIVQLDCDLRGQSFQSFKQQFPFITLSTPSWQLFNIIYDPFTTIRFGPCQLYTSF